MNLRPCPYEEPALPLSYSGIIKYCFLKPDDIMIYIFDISISAIDICMLPFSSQRQVVIKGGFSLISVILTIFNYDLFFVLQAITLG